MKIFTLTLMFICVGFSNINFAAPNNQDCANAIPVCQNTYSTTISYSGSGNVGNEINDANSCLGTGETNDVWYIITVTGSGNLNFSIRPKNYINILGIIFCDDYDWAVYNLTNANCSDIYTNPALEVSCNFSSDQDITGTRNSGTLNSQDAFGNTWNKSIPVVAGQTYLLNVSNFSGSQSGYDLSFAGSTASIFDNVKPSVLSITPQCNSTVNIKFSENVLCSTVQGSDFTVTGPGGPYTANITTSSCLSGSTYENDFGLTITPPFSQNGTYTVALTGNVTDNCGNVSNLGSNSIIINNALNIGRDTSLCSGQNITLNATTAAATSYLWSTGSVSPTISVNSTGTFFVTVVANGCTLRDTIKVTVNPTGPVSLSIAASANNICNGINVAFTATPAPASGLAPNYQWYVGTTPQGTNSPVYNTTALVNGDVVKVVMTSSVPCITGSPATSNTVTMVVNQPTTATINRAICQGQSVTVGGQTFSTVQTNRIITLTNGNSKGCDSVITLNLIVNQPTTSTINQIICQGQSVTVGGQTFTTPQTNKIIVLANANNTGCDSTITLNLVVNSKTTSTINQIICQGQSVTVGGQIFTTPQTNKIIVLANANSTGCDSTITLNLIVNQPTTSNINQIICQGQSITVGGQTFTTTQTNKVIVLSNANSTGCDSTITLNLIVNQPTISTINQIICQGQSITVGGQTFNTPQINKIIVLPNANSKGCDSTITLNLIVNQPTTFTINQIICQGQSVTVGGQIFTTPQTNKIIVLANANSKGCDSIITLNLIVNPKSTRTINQIICQGQSVTVGGQIFTTTQINKIIVLTNANSFGCDSTITLNLVVNQPTISNINQSICQGRSITVGGQTFTTTQINKIIVLSNGNSKGCDSTITLNLIVTSTITSNVNRIICQGQNIIVGGQVFSTPQVNKIITLVNGSSQGCDSVITLNLTVNQPTSSTLNLAICPGQSVTVGGQNFTTSQLNKIITLPNANTNGCDSVITLNLKINPNTISTINQIICQGQSVTVGGQTFTTAQTNKIIVLANANSNGCDSTISLTLKVNPTSSFNSNQTICQGQSVTVGGQTFTTTQTNKIIVLANANSKGCDSTITLNLIVNQPTVSAINQSICQGQSVTVGGQTFTTTQTNKVIVLSNANSTGCDSTITLNLIVNPKTTSTINQSICQGQSVTVGGQTFTTTQTNKVIVLSNANSTGCDSTITLNLVVNQPTVSAINQSICQGQSVTVGGQTFTTTQSNKVIVLSNANSNGCDSTITLNLIVNPKTTSTINQSICQGQSITVGGQIFTTTQTNKIIVLSNANSTGCDSTITLNLIVNPKTTSTINQSICQGQSITVGGQIFTTTQTNKIIVLSNANSNGCDSTITLNLIVNPKTTSTINQSICQGQSVTVGGQTFTTTQTNKVIVLSNANSNGCDSTITLNLIVNPKTTSTINQSICQGQSVTVGGQTFTTTQTNKIIVLANANSTGCDSTITLNLIVSSAISSSFNQSICQGQSVTVGGQVFTTTQINKIITLVNGSSQGCDSVITLNLIVNQPTVSTINQIICQGQSVTVGGQTFTSPQANKIIVLTNANSNGCDSTITLNLIVNPKTTSTINQIICQGQSVTVGGQTFTTTQTNKVIVLSNANSTGCDSTITLNLVVNQPTVSAINQIICQGQSVTVGGQTFTTTQNNKIIVLANANSTGCDSTITLNLMVNPKTTSSINQTICQGQSVTVGGQIFTTTQTNKIIVLANANSNGCDSTITLNLTVNPKTTSSINQTICNGQSVTVGGQIFTTAQTNKVIVLSNANSTGCDSTITLNLVVNQPTVSAINQSICQGQSVTVGGQIYTTTQTNKIIVLTNANSNGCDSTITLNLIVNPALVPTVSIVSDKNDICINDRIIFTANASNTGGAASYQWYLNSIPVGPNSNQFSSSTLNDNDAIKVVITTTATCANPKTVISNVIKAIVNKISYTKPLVEYCKGNTFQVDFNNMPITTTPNPNFIISWTNGSQVTTDSTSQYAIDNTTTTNIPFQIKYGNNCRVNDVLVVKVNPLPQIDAIVDLPRVKYEDTVQLGVDLLSSHSILTNYNWMPVSKVSNPGIIDPISQITASVMFIVKVKDNNECENTDSIFVELIDECQEDYIFVPSAFSPNHDGLNDCFQILSPPILSDFKMVIFDRWGERLFETNSEKDCWNGTYKGIDAMSDSYPYVISYKCYNGISLSKKGTISIIK